MDSIRIKNLRCFRDTGEINLKPLTVAVGKNSCGKSTILRVFPLFKQSLETRTSEPILWYGRYVDFGEFSQSKNKKTTDRTIDFEFNFNIPLKLHSHHMFISFEEDNINIENTNIKAIFHIDKDNISGVDFLIFNKNVTITYNIKKNMANIKIDGNDCGNFEISNKNEIGSIIPYINSTALEDVDRFIFSKFYMSNKKEILHQINDADIFDIISSIVKKAGVKDFESCILCIYLKLVESFLDFENAYKEIRKNLSTKKQNKSPVIFGRMDPTSNENKQTVNMLIELLKKSENKISDLIIMLYIPTIIRNCNLYFDSFFENVKYIAPVRATAERYYRKQGLDIQDVDSRGENVAAILQSMRLDENNKFARWLNKNFGFGISTDSTEGHISLYITSNGSKFNIADTGFGYSQILPIILMLWKIVNKENLNIEKQIIIEQPELHLHPKMQIQLIDAILALIKGNTQIKFLLETHSETIINYLGKKIEDKTLKRDIVNILLVEQDENNMSNVRQVGYSEDGYLEDWPLDFFQED